MALGELIYKGVFVYFKLEKCATKTCLHLKISTVQVLIISERKIRRFLTLRIKR